MMRAVFRGLIGSTSEQPSPYQAKGGGTYTKTKGGEDVVRV